MASPTTANDPSSTRPSSEESHVAAPDARVPSESESPFAQSCIRLLSLARGHSSYTPAHKPVRLVFELTDEEASQITRWNKRDTDTG